MGRTCRFFNHTVQHAAHFLIFSMKICVLFTVDVIEVAGKIQPDLGFARFPRTIYEFADESLLVTPLFPCLGKVGGDASGRTPDLVDQGIFFFFRKYLRQLVNFQCKLVCELKYL